MIYSVLSFVFGVFITIWYLVLDFSFNFDHFITVSIVIAAATAIATAIHFDSVRNQRKDRLWEINKGSLLRLSKDLSDAIEMSSKLSDREFNRQQGNLNNTCTDGSGEINQQFKEVISDFLNVYKPLLSADLIFAIEEYQTVEKNIKEMWEKDVLSIFKAYDEQLAAQKKLQEVIAKFIKDVSGVSYT